MTRRKKRSRRMRRTNSNRADRSLRNLGKRARAVPSKMKMTRRMKKMKSSKQRVNKARSTVTVNKTPMRVSRLVLIPRAALRTVARLGSKLRISCSRSKSLPIWLARSITRHNSTFQEYT